MAKKHEEENKAVVPVSDLQTAMAEMAQDDDLYAFSGAGVSHEQEDRLVPILGVVQENSGEVKKKGPKYVEGVEPGMMIIRSVGKTFTVDKDENALIFQPCAFQHVWVEWQGEPGDGVPVGQFPFNDKPRDAREVADPQNAERKLWIRENGNRLVETRYHYGHIVLPEGPMAVVLPMAGTNHKASRKMTQFALSKRIPTPKGPINPPAWFGYYALTTKYQQRGTQSWYSLDVKELSAVPPKDLRDLGRALFESVTSGDVAAKLDDVGDGDAGAGGDTEAPI